MKVALCTGSLDKGGVGTSLRILCAGMQAAGHQCDIITTLSKVGNDHECGVHEGLPIKAISIGLRWFRRVLENTLEHLSQYDVVINNHSIATQLVLPALPKHIARLSVIRRINEPVIRGALMNSSSLDALVGISPMVTRLLRETEVDCPAHTIPNSSTPSIGGYPPLYNALKIIYLGRLTEIDKNILILPEIVTALKKRGLKFSLKIAGCGIDRERLEKKIHQMGVREHIRLLGNLPRQAATEILMQSNFSIIPSNYEGFGLVLTEAMTAGCIPITSDIPVFSWILGEDAELLQAPVKNAEAYADRLYSIAKNHRLYASLQQSLRRRQRDTFGPESTVNGYLKLIEDLCEHRDEERFLAVPLANLPLPKHYKRRCTRAWWLLQKIKDRLCG